MLRNPSQMLHRIAPGLLVLVGIWGLSTALFPLRPFWIDEWRLIYNLKFKSAAALWGPLDFTQQAPRMYLAILKRITAAAHYSYVSLRLPSFLISIGSMLLAWRTMRRIFPDREDWLRLLFPLIVVSSQTFTDYLIQAKHYEVEIFLALTAIWQTLGLMNVAEDGIRSRSGYIMLCVTMAVAPPFSYTYPIAIAPAFFLTVVRCIQLARNKEWDRIALLITPLFLCVCGIALFFITDVSQLMRDEEMRRYWAYRMARNGVREAALQLWNFFASMGSGLVCEVVFGALGIAAFGVALSRIADMLRSRMTDCKCWLQAYGALLVLLCFLLSFAGKLPLGEAKFNAFCVPALSILIVALLQRLRGRRRIGAIVVGGFLFAGLAGNIILVVVNAFYAPDYMRRMAIYHRTEAAIASSQSAHMPMFITPGIAWPDEIVHKVAHLQNMPADAILRTWPAYDAAQALPVFAISDTAAARSFLNALPDSIRTVVAGDGLDFRRLSR